MKSFRCQCPEWGDLHFYKRKLVVRKRSGMCQCPEWGDLHFYIANAAVAAGKSNVSMP